MSRVSSKLPSVATPTIGGVSIKRHVLDLEAGSLGWITRRVGRRLSRWLRSTPEEIQGFLIKWEEGRPVPVPMLDLEGKPIMVPCLPDSEFRETWRWYQNALLGLLKEQRERAKLTPKNGAPALTDEEYEAAHREMVAESIRTMSDGELEAMLMERHKASALTVDAVVVETKNE